MLLLLFILIPLISNSYYLQPETQSTGDGKAMIRPLPRTSLFRGFGYCYLFLCWFVYFHNIKITFFNSSFVRYKHLWKFFGGWRLNWLGSCHFLGTPLHSCEVMQAGLWYFVRVYYRCYNVWMREREGDEGWWDGGILWKNNGRMGTQRSIIQKKVDHITK